MKRDLTEERDLIINFAIQLISKEVADEKFKDFLEVLKINGFLNDLSAEDVDYGYCFPLSYGPGLPLFAYNKVKIGIELYDGKAYVGIDPSKCYDSLKRCSVLVCFPMKKREYNRFKNFVTKILDTKSSLRNEWLKEAPSCFYGQYATFGIC